MQQGVHQGPLLMAGSDVHNHAGRFVDHHKVLILMKDPQRDVLGARPCGSLGSLLLNKKNITRRHLIAAADAVSLSCDASRFDQGLDFRTGKMTQMPDKHHVEPLMVVLFGSCDFVDGRLGHGDFWALMGQAA